VLIVSLTHTPPVLRHVSASLIVALVFSAVPTTAQDRPLPDPKTFLPEVRKRLQTDQTLQSSYSYVETRRERKLDGKGRVDSESVKVFENYPGLPGETRWERLISENGKAVPAKDLEKHDRERREKAEEYARRMTNRPEQERARQNRDWEKARKEMAETVDDIFRVYDVRMAGRESIDGHDTIRFSLTPRPDADPHTSDGKIMRHFNGTAWVSETDYELVRLNVEAIDTVGIGLGLLARVNKGARIAFERRKVNGEVWLPATASYSFNARVAMLKMLRRDATLEFSNYRKYTVDTSSTFAGPAQ
jgi:hypothetical protein